MKNAFLFLSFFEVVKYMDGWHQEGRFGLFQKGRARKKMTCSGRGVVFIKNVTVLARCWPCI
jgi:hypothetical protein